MIKEVSAMEARKTFGDLLNEIKYLHSSIIINKSGKRIAALIDINLFEKLTKYHAELEAHVIDMPPPDNDNIEIEQEVSASQ
ncbi:MAG: type II toxin-antitoxin system prevent-host-death family antitoxin [Candidatus Paracaedibacter sp.]